MKKSHNKTKTTSPGYIWIDPSKGKWARPLVGDKKDGIVGYYEICDVEDEEKEDIITIPVAILLEDKKE